MHETDPYGLEFGASRVSISLGAGTVSISFGASRVSISLGESRVSISDNSESPGSAPWLPSPNLESEIV